MKFILIITLSLFNILLYGQDRKTLFGTYEAVKKDGKWGIFDLDKQIVPYEYDFIQFRTYYLQVAKDSKYGTLELNGKESIPCIYTKFSRMDGLLYFKVGLVINGEIKYGIINLKNEEITPCKYHEITNFNKKDFVAFVGINNKYGVINLKGEEIVPCKYHPIGSRFSDGLLIVHTNNKTGYVNKKGEKVIPIKYSKGRAFKDGRAQVYQKKSTGIIDTKGKTIIPLIYTDIEISTYNGQPIYIVTTDKKSYGIIDRYGEVFVPCQYRYDIAWEKFREKVNGTHYQTEGMSEKEIFEIVKYNYDFVDTKFSFGLLAVGKSDRFGFVDTKGEVFIDLRYSSVEAFTNGFSKVKFDNLYGVLNKNGKVVILCDYSKIEQREYKGQPVFLVQKEGEWGAIDKKGDEFVSAEYSYTEVWEQFLEKVKGTYFEDEEKIESFYPKVGISKLD